MVRNFSFIIKNSEAALQSGYTDNDDSRNGISHMFIERGQQHNILHAIFSKINYLVDQKYPIVRSHKVLRPIFWIYFPMQYFYRLLIDRRKIIDVVSVFSSANEYRELYSGLRLYETESGE